MTWYQNFYVILPPSQSLLLRFDMMDSCFRCVIRRKSSALFCSLSLCLGVGQRIIPKEGQEGSSSICESQAIATRNETEVEV